MFRSCYLNYRCWLFVISLAMARPLRIEYDGALYHVTSRGDDRKPIFKDDSDRKLFLNTLTRVTERFHWVCHAYCLMNNHYHLVIENTRWQSIQGNEAA